LNLVYNYTNQYATNVSSKVRGWVVEGPGSRSGYAFVPELEKRNIKQYMVLLEFKWIISPLLNIVKL